MSSMNSIELIQVALIYHRSVRYTAGYVLLFTSTARLLVFTSQMALRTCLTGLYNSGVARNFALLAFIGRV
jgi:hypothetical protein